MTKPINITLFHADWCGHCVNFMPTFEAMKNNKQANMNIGFNKVSDIELANLQKNKRQINGVDIEGFPTIKIDIQGNTYNYMGERTQEKIYNFILDKLESSNNVNTNTDTLTGTESTKRVSDFDRNSNKFYLLHEGPENFSNIEINSPKIQEHSNIMSAIDMPGGNINFKNQQNEFNDLMNRVMNDNNNYNQMLLNNNYNQMPLNNNYNQMPLNNNYNQIPLNNNFNQMPVNNNFPINLFQNMTETDMPLRNMNNNINTAIMTNRNNINNLKFDNSNTTINPVPSNNNNLFDIHKQKYSDYLLNMIR
jgi:thiol-disulfide isomerase/thioredoxin